MEASTDGRAQPKLTMVFIEHSIYSSQPEGEEQASVPCAATKTTSHNTTCSPFNYAAVSQNSSNSSIGLQARDTIDQTEEHVSSTADNLGPAASVSGDVETRSEPRGGGSLSDDGRSTRDSTSENRETRTSLFRLPIEIRLMIWKLCLPGQRVFRATVRYGFPLDEPNKAPAIRSSSDPGRWFFRVRAIQGSPNLKILQICSESRDVALQHGKFVFGNESYEETGMWWNSELDVLFFNHDWSLGRDTWGLRELSGLNYVKNVAVDAEQAAYICYEIAYDGPWPNIERSQRDVLGITLSFREASHTPHYIPEFFPSLAALSIHFRGLHLHNGKDEWRFMFPPSGIYHGCPRDWHDDEHCCTITFRIGAAMSEARKKLARYRELCGEYFRLYRGFRQCLLEIDFDMSNAPNRYGPVYSIKQGICKDEIESDYEVDFDMCCYDDKECL